MTLRDFKRLMRRNWLLLLAIPLVTAVSIYFFARSQDKIYTSNTVLYTGIATGSRIANGEETGPRAADYAYGNMLSLMTSRETKEEVITRLLATHLMLPTYDPSVLNEKTYIRLNELISDTLKRELVGKTVEETAQNISNYYKADNKNVIYKLINSDDPVYSRDAFQKLETERMGASDLVKVQYTSNDAATTYQTLVYLTQIFTRKYEELFSGQNGSVMGYFDVATKQAYDKLQEAQQNLIAFQRENGIVDYDQQISSSSTDKDQAIAQYKELEMQYTGALAALNSAEEQLEKRGASTLKSQEIIRLRNQLSDLNNQIMEMEMQGATKPANPDKLARLKQEAKQVSDQIQDNVAAYEANNTVQGIPLTGVLETYAQNSILVEELKTKLEVLRRQRDASAGEYAELAPMGAEIRNLKRAVEVAEQEYAAQLEGLKQSKLKQQNIELASNLKVVDPPFLPTRSEGTSMVLLVLFGFIGAFLLTGAGVFAADMMDNSLRKPAHAARAINMPILGVLPAPGRRSNKQLTEAKRAEDQLARQVLLKLQQRHSTHSPQVVGVLSSYSGEGKTTVCNALASSLNKMGIETMSLIPDGHAYQEASYNINSFYSPLKGVSSNITLADITGRGNNQRTTDVVLVEFPALLESAYPVALLEHLDLILVTVRTNRTWEQADRAVYDNIQKITKAPIEVVLNGVLHQYVRDYVGAPLGIGSSASNQSTNAPQEIDKWEQETPVLNP